MVWFTKLRPIGGRGSPQPRHIGGLVVALLVVGALTEAGGVDWLRDELQAATSTMNSAEEIRLT
jgi:hypothetical protein